MEERIRFSCGDHQLEGLYNVRSGNTGVVVLHPHPLYGGEMGNPVVESAVDVYGRRGWSTLRFNFRGVGGSEGHYDNGDGEQQDILAAVRFLAGEGKTRIHLVGYSFGSWVMAQIAALPREVAGLVMISPPIALLPLPENLELPLLKLVVTGENDEFSPVETVTKSMTGWNRDARFVVIDDADHFYFGSFKVLEQAVAEFLAGEKDG